MPGVAPDRTAQQQLDARADWSARITAIVVLVAGLLVIVLPAVLHLGEVWNNPFLPTETTVVEVTTNADGSVVRKTTTSEADRSFVERSLSAGGLLLLRIGAVALAAFLAGAVVQRAVLARFEMKLGPLELRETRRAAAASEEALEAIQGDLARNVEATRDAMRVAADAAEAVAAVSEETAGLKEDVAILIALLENASVATGEAREDEESQPGVAGGSDVDVQLGEERAEKDD